MIKINEDYEIVKTFKSKTGNVIHIARLRRDNTPEEIKDFYRAFVKLMIKNESCEDKC